MKIYRTCVFIMLISLAFQIADASSLPLQECNQLEVKVAQTETTEGRDNGSASVEIVRGDKRSAKYIFCERKGKVLNEGKFNESKIEGLKKGEYLCIVSTSDCTKKVSFSIN